MEEALDEVEEGKLSWTKALAAFDKTFTRDRNRALKDMVSGKAGILLARREGPQALGRPEDRREVPDVRQEAEAAHGQERPLRGLQRLPGLHLHAEHPRSRGRRRRRFGDREHDVRGVRLAHEAAPEPHGLDLPRLHGVPEVPQRRQRRGRGRQGRGAARRADGGEVPALRPRARPAPRALRRLRVLLELPGVQVQAAQADQGHGRALSEGRRHHRRAARPLPPVLRLRQLSQLRLLALGAARSRRRARSAATRTCSTASASRATSLPATRPAADSRRRPA